MSNDEEEKVRFVLKGAGLSFERDIDAGTASSLLQFVLRGDGLDARSSSGDSGASPEKKGPPLSFREFLDRVQPKSNPEKIAAFASYLRDHVGQDDASKEEIRSCFRSAGDSPPGNFHRDFQNAVQAGWIAEDPARGGRFYLTRKGEEFINRG